MKNFNVRVYGILIHDNKVLVSDEHIKGMNITKLPGGGLEFGEGTIECVIREFKEELDLEIEVESHFYTTDFFVNSAFSINNQVISIYYKVKPTKEFNPLKSGFKISNKPFDFEKKKFADAKDRNKNLEFENEKSRNELNLMRTQINNLLLENDNCFHFIAHSGILLRFEPFFYPL